MERAPRCARFQPSGVPQKRGTKSCACSLCLPRQSGPGSQGLGGRTLPRCGAPTPFRGPSFSFRWRQLGVCAFCPPGPQPQSPPAPVGCLRPVSRRDLPLPPASCLRRGWAGPQPASSSLDPLGLFVLRTAGSVFGPANLLSLLWSPTVQVGNSQKLPPIVLRALRPGPYPKQCRLRAPGTDLRP